MPPTVILVRHAQALHNSTNYGLHDPLLTDEGLQQCAALRESLMRRLEGETDIAIVVSPMKRTIQTALASLDWLIDRGVPITADADWQETTVKPCDTGTPVSEVSAEYPMIDFSSVDPVFPDKTSPAGHRYFCTKRAIVERGRACLESLVKRPEKFVIVVSHSGFLRSGVVGWWFFNADYRIFDFADGAEAEHRPRMVQWESTVSGGLGLSFPDPVELGAGLPDDEPVGAP